MKTTRATIENLWDGDTTIYSVKAGNKLIGRYWYYDEAIEAMNKYNDNIEEEETMETTTKTTFTVNEITYTLNPASGRFAKTANGKTTRIGKAEYEAAKAEYDSTIKAEQEELDANPCMVEVDTDLDKPAVLNEFGCVDCSKCDVTHCVHRNCMRRNPKSEGGLGECPRLANGIAGVAEKIAEEKGIELAEAELEANIRKEKKVPKKTRRSKDIAYEGHGVTLTAKQVDFIHHLPDTCFWEHGLDSTPWTDVLADDIGGQFAGKPMTTGAMISTICEKGLAVRGKMKVNGRNSTFMELTELGKTVAKELGLE